MMTAGECSEYIDRRGKWTAPNGLGFFVLVVDVRQVFNRVDFHIKPVDGGGPDGRAWVSAELVDLDGGPEGGS